MRKDEEELQNFKDEDEIASAEIKGKALLRVPSA
jgi:hypothetical protein